MPRARASDLATAYFAPEQMGGEGQREYPDVDGEALAHGATQSWAIGGVKIRKVAAIIFWRIWSANYLCGRPRVTSVSMIRLYAARRKSRPPRKFSSFAAVSSPFKVGRLRACVSRSMYSAANFSAPFR